MFSPGSHRESVQIELHRVIVPSGRATNQLPGLFFWQLWQPTGGIYASPRLMSPSSTMLWASAWPISSTRISQASGLIVITETPGSWARYPECSGSSVLILRVRFPKHSSGLGYNTVYYPGRLCLLGSCSRFAGTVQIHFFSCCYLVRKILVQTLYRVTEQIRFVPVISQTHRFSNQRITLFIQVEWLREPWFMTGFCCHRYKFVPHVFNTLLLRHKIVPHGHWHESYLFK